MKIKNLVITSLIALTLVGCGSIPTNSSDSTKNEVTIESITVVEEATEEQQLSRKMKKELNSDEVIEGYNYVIIKKDQTDVQFTITLDNPESYGIDALRITCDDLEAQIQVDGEWKPIAQEKDNTRVVNWSSEDPYEKTYNIRTTSLEDLYTFKVVDIRLAGQDTFLSKQTRSTDFGNNELDIYKMDVDAYELDVAYNTFDEIKFKMNVKEGVSNISNFKVDGNEANEDGYWIMNESKEDVEISYDFTLDNGIVIRHTEKREIELLEFMSSMYDHSSVSSFGMVAYQYTAERMWQFVNITHFIFYFEINRDFEIYFDDKKLMLMDEYGYDDGSTKYHAYEFEYNDFLDISAYYIGSGVYGNNDANRLKSKDDITNFMNRFTVKIYGIEYKFKIAFSFNGYYEFDKITGLKKVEA